MAGIAGPTAPATAVIPARLAYAVGYAHGNADAVLAALTGGTGPAAPATAVTPTRLACAVRRAHANAGAALAALTGGAVVVDTTLGAGATAAVFV